MKVLFAVARGCAVLGFVGAIAACRREQPPPTLTPTEAVTQYFAAVKARDCSALATLSGGVVAHRLKEHGCEGILVSYAASKLELVSIQSAAPDGRDPTLTLVNATLKSLGSTGSYSTKDVIIRVSTAGGRTRIVEL